MLLTEAACRCWVFTKWDKRWYKSLSSSALWLSKTTIRHWSYKLQQADQNLSPICYAKFKIWDLKIISSKVFLIFWRSSHSGQFKSLCLSLNVRLVHGYSCLLCFFIHRTDDRNFLKKPLLAGNIEIKISLGFHLFCDFQFSLCY